MESTSPFPLKARSNENARPHNVLISRCHCSDVVPHSARTSSTLIRWRIINAKWKRQDKAQNALDPQLFWAMPFTFAASSLAMPTHPKQNDGNWDADVMRVFNSIRKERNTINVCARAQRTLFRLRMWAFMIYRHLMKLCARVYEMLLIQINETWRKRSRSFRRVLRGWMCIFGFHSIYFDTTYRHDKSICAIIIRHSQCTHTSPHFSAYCSPFLIVRSL